MKIYKVVPAQGRVVVKEGENPSAAIGAIANVLMQESAGGWTFVSSMPVSVSVKKRKGYEEQPYNALVFSKNVIPAAAEEEKK